MKQLATILIAALLFSSCKKNDIKEQPEKPKPEVCDFGITEFSTARRIGKGRPIKPPKNPTYPVNPSGVLLLDFDGHVVSNTAWNMGQDIVATPSGLDASEQKRVLDSVAFDYAEFNVAVTADEALFNAAPTTKRMRVILTENWSWYGQAGGVAYRNSYTWADETPCFVFTSLLSYSTKNIQEATSHELGHTAGLRHQQVGYVDEMGVWIATSEYNYGEGCCAPIMGAAYYRNGLWWKNPVQDDRLILKTTFQ